MQPDEYIYSPMYYSGSKNRLLYWLIPLFPKNISTFYDLFCGGLSVSVNVRAEKYVASDVSPFVINLYRAMQEAGSVGFMAKVDSYIQEYHVDDCKHESFYALRDAYNSKSDKYNSPEMLFTLVCYAYNSVLRFNSHDEYNIAPGRGATRLSQPRRANIYKFIDAISARDIEFLCESYASAMCLDGLDSDAFVYCDPPYIVSAAEYNTRWKWMHEYALYAFLDKLHSKGVKFGLSNVIRMGNKYNHVLDNWSKKYTVHNCTKVIYHGSQSNRQHKNAVTEEVYICNY